MLALKFCQHCMMVIPGAPFFLLAKFLLQGSAGFRRIVLLLAFQFNLDSSGGQTTGYFSNRFRHSFSFPSILLGTRLEILDRASGS